MLKKAIDLLKDLNINELEDLQQNIGKIWGEKIHYEYNLRRSFVKPGQEKTIIINGAKVTGTITKITKRNIVVKLPDGTEEKLPLPQNEKQKMEELTKKEFEKYKGLFLNGKPVEKELARVKLIEHLESNYSQDYIKHLLH